MGEFLLKSHHSVDPVRVCERTFTGVIRFSLSVKISIHTALVVSNGLKIILISMENDTLKNVNNCLNTS